VAAPITERRAIFCLRQNAFKLYASWLFDLLACQSLILLVRRNTEIPIFVKSCWGMIVGELLKLSVAGAVTTPWRAL
jgi:hypothetical protein